MKIQLNADLMTKKGMIHLAGKIVEVKDEIRTKPKTSHYTFMYKGKELKIQKKFTTEIK